LTAFLAAAQGAQNFHRQRRADPQDTLTTAAASDRLGSCASKPRTCRSRCSTPQN